MHRFTFSPEFIKRFSAYLQSREYRQALPSHAKTEYWKEHSKLISAKISGNRVAVDGVSGCYIPPRKDFSSLITFIRSRINPAKKRISLLNYFEAFDAVMSHDSIANIVPANKYRINFKELTKNPSVIAGTKEMKERFFAKDKYCLSPLMVNTYYLWNILCSKASIDKIQCVLEIGAGNGNFAGLLRHYLGAQMIIVDLPETLCLSIPFLADLFPDANILMPHEVESRKPQKFDFLFLTPNQLDRIDDGSVDLISNICSFQEMTHEQIGIYFDLIKRAAKNCSYFFTQNRVEKIPGSSRCQESSVPVRFAEYPWMPGNKVLVYEICSLNRLVQLSDIYIRLEQIRKD